MLFHGVAYPDVKPEDGWASASRLEMWMPEMVRGDNDFVVFDLYIHPIRGRPGFYVN